MDFTVQLLDESASSFKEEKNGKNGLRTGRVNGTQNTTDAAQHVNPATAVKLEDAIIAWLRDYATNHHVRVMVAGIGVPRSQTVSGDNDEIRLVEHLVAAAPADKTAPEGAKVAKLRLPARLWFELDIVPLLLETHGYSIDERACSAARKAELFVNPPGNIPRITVGYRHKVEVDGNGRIHICDLEDYQRTVCDKTWNKLLELVKVTRDRKLKVAFVNSTPQGGGVALMRHALIRLLRLLDLDIAWYVMKPKPEIFDITKRKFHNVLQGVAKKDVHLTDEEMQIYEEWCEDNVERYWADGPIVESDVIVIDDPQPSGIIPYIKRLNPKCKIIYRSHIEVRADLVADPTTEQHRVWTYLWNFIRHADAFISHPVAAFVPHMVPRTHLLMMPATTDRLDGLNKQLDEASIQYYQSLFNRTSADATRKQADFGRRPYIVQIARFDPSKGYPDVIRAYKKLRERLPRDWPMERIPQLVLGGHGSIDDPDGTMVYEQVLHMLEEEEFLDIAGDVIAARLPPSDQLLNTLVRGALVSLQLSIREGFEIKVTEALEKGVPVIAYASGGIPHQIRDGETGYLVTPGDVDGVVDKLLELVVDEERRKAMGQRAKKFIGEEYFTVFQCVNWLYLFNAVHTGTWPLAAVPDSASASSSPPTDPFEAKKHKLAGGAQFVKDFWVGEDGVSN
ncbi:hypothetical protein HK104_006703 [Borealophlyctis nickersoniae]|nr:hypothetical protein HK104_006703 [Borealophlyctis nickersoniae]